MIRRLTLRVLPAAIALAIASHAPQAAADPHSGVDAQLYRPSLDAFGIWTLESASGLKQYDFSLKLGVGYAANPLQVAVPGIGDPVENAATDSALTFALTFNMTAAFAVTPNLSFAIDVGLARTDPADGYGDRGVYRDAANGGPEPSTGLISLRPVSNIDPSGGFEPQGHSVPTDARIGAKYQLSDPKSKLRFALLGIVSVPFGDEEMFLGDRSFVIEPRLAAEYELAPNSRLVFNAGAKLRRRTVLEAWNPNMSGQTPEDAVGVLDVGSEAVLGVGLLYELAPQLILAGEISAFVPIGDTLSWGDCELADGRPCGGAAMFDEDLKSGDMAGLGMVGLNYRATPDTSLSVGGGSGKIPGFGDGRGEDFRVMGGVIWSPTPEGTRVIGRGDIDGDGVGDRIDICPEEPEDNDGYQDEDGCPDLDNDGDGVIDAQDSCPDEPEDRDGYQDEDGCPELDNDGDGVSDVTDRCPNEKEDFDKFEDDDGCPDDDNDGDGIPDAKDQCPNEAETVNGVDDLDGCPDESIAGVVMDPDKINLRGQSIKFTRRDNLTAADKAILDDVARVMNKPENRDIAVRIEVHVQLSTKSKNKTRIKRAQRSDKSDADKRAAVIQRYLVDKGVEAGRATPAGIGSERPLVQPAWDTQNDRVEFIRTQQR
jgi:hypothetical protein